MRFSAEVPATVANLGPGFDAFGLALDLANVVTIDTEADGVAWEGEGAAELPTDGSDLVSRTIRAVAPGAPAFGLRGRNAIPLERGLGSSAAAVVAGVLLGRALAGEPTDPADVLPVAAAIEGHPDNAAAAIHGGFTIVAGTTIVRCDVVPTVAPVVLIPLDVRTSTGAARAALPSSVPLADAAGSAACAALVPLALTQDPRLLATALEDRLHQDVRLAAVPTVRAVFDRLRAAGVPVCLAGSGPSLLAFEVDGRPVAEPGEGWRVLRSGVRATGARLSRDA
jgi:homoserine kinase